MMRDVRLREDIAFMKFMSGFGGTAHHRRFE
jgi:hypothetical protein